MITVFTNGCFDIIHLGHIKLLEECKKISKNGRVVVGLNSDKSVKRLKGKTRPIKTYSIVDIWKQNILEYEKILPETTISFDEEILPKNGGDTSQNSSKILPRTAVEEDLILRITTKKSRAFSPPSLNEVKSYCEERKNNVDAENFINFYESKGWFVGKNKMKDWRAAVRTWENRDKQNGKVGGDEIYVPEYAKNFNKNK